MTLELPLLRTVTLDPVTYWSLPIVIPGLTKIAVQRTKVCHYVDYHITRTFAEDTPKQPNRDVYFHIRVERALRTWMRQVPDARHFTLPSMMQYHGGGELILTYTFDTSPLTISTIIDHAAQHTTMPRLHDDPVLDALVAAS